MIITISWKVNGEEIACGVWTSLISHQRRGDGDEAEEVGEKMITNRHESSRIIDGFPFDWPVAPLGIGRIGSKTVAVG